MQGLKLPLIVATVIFVVDQISKYWIVQVLDLKSRQFIEVFEPFLVLRMAWNTGINFGLFSEHGDTIRWVLIAVALLITAWILWWMWRDAPGRWAQFAAGLVVGGALGNVIDRVIYGAVADFLNMSCCGFENPYSFNVADISIFIGAVGLIFLTGETQKDA